MQEFRYVITDEMGIHARPAGLLVKEAQKYKSDITIENGGKSGNMKSIFSVMSVSAKKGDKVTVKVNGPDEKSAAEFLNSFFKQNL